MQSQSPNLDLVAEPLAQERAVWPAMRRGLLCKCPACGEGKLFRAFLKVANACPACGEDLSHQRADDGPAYVTILIVGHILGPLILWLYAVGDPDPLLVSLVLSLGSIVLSLLLLPRIKGAFVGFQWAKKMHGFGSNPRG